MTGWKFLYDRERMTLLIGEDVNLLRGVLMGEMSKYLTDGWDSPPIPMFSHKGSGEGGQDTTGGGQQIKSKEGSFGSEGGYRGYNSGTLLF